jgi:hypothetical protein
MNYERGPHFYMKRIILAAVFQLLAVAAVILSLKPRLDLFFYEHSEHRYGYYDAYWNYFIIQSWLIALAGISAGLVLFWISRRIKSKDAVAKNVAALPRFSIGRIACVICLVAGAMLACAFLPGLSGLFGRNALDYHVPMELSHTPAASQIFMIMSNDLATPHIEIRLPEKYTN